METRRMANQSDTTTYSTKDLYEASFLYAVGKKLIDLTRNGPQAWFIFEDQSGCQDLAKVFWAKDGEIAPKVYAEAIRSLKDMLFAHN